MNYDVLIKEQSFIFKFLNKLNVNNFSHAYLIETNNNSDGALIAKLLAYKILFDKVPSDLNEVKLLDNHLDFSFVTSMGNNIKKEQILELQEKFNKKSLDGSKKVYILNEAEKLNLTSANTILKFLEEPADGVTAILVVNNRYQLLETIISRCQLLSLNVIKRNGCSTLENILNNVSNKVEYETFLNENSDYLLHIYDFLTDYELNNIDMFVYSGKYIHSKFKDKLCIKYFIYILILFYKDCLNKKIGLNCIIFIDNIDILDDVIYKNTTDMLINKIKCLNVCLDNLNSNCNLSLLIDRLLIEMEKNND